ncbi:MAG: PKD domain-containing protein, partial [Bacteroidota bacterium]
MKQQHTLMLVISLWFGLGNLSAQYPGFTPSSNIICQNYPVDFTNHTPNLFGYTYYWDFGDNNFDTTAAHPQHTYSQVDTFPVTLSMTGDSFIYVLKSIKIHWVKQSSWYSFWWDKKIDPYLKIKGSQNSSGNTSTSHFKDVTLPVSFSFNKPLGLQNYVVHVWDYDAGSNDDYCGAFNIPVPGGSGSVSNSNFTISWVIDSFLVQPFSDTIEVRPAPSTPLVSILSPDSVCFGDSVWLSATTDPGLSIEWMLNGQVVDTGLHHYARVAGTYYARVTNAAGCAPTSQGTPVHIRPPLNPGIQAPQAYFCSGDTLKLEANLQGSGYTYQWYQDSVPNSGNQSPSLWITESGHYQIRVSDAFGCEDISPPAFFGEVPVYVAEISPPGLHKICEGEELLLEAQSGNGLIYDWYQDSQLVVSTSLVTYGATAAGSYYVIMTDSAGCQQDTSNVVNLTLLDAPAGGSISGESEMCEGTDVMLNFLPDTGALQIQWLLDGQPLSNETFNYLMADQPGTYQVLSTNLNQCETLSPPWQIVGLPAPVPQVYMSNQELSTDPAAQYTWYEVASGQPVSNDASFVPMASGSYYVEVIYANGCSNVSEPFDFWVTEVEDALPKVQASLFPNPNRGEFKLQVEVNTQVTARMEVYDLSGKQVDLQELDLQPGQHT